MTTVTVSVLCPCCARSSVNVDLAQGMWPEEPNAWGVDDFDASCDCHDFVCALKLNSTLCHQAGDDYYRERLRDRALEAM